MTTGQMAGRLGSQRSAFVLPLFLKFQDFLVQQPYHVLRFLDGGHQRASFAFPSLHPFIFGASPTEFDFDLLADAAYCLHVLGPIHEFHAARLAGPIFIVALVGKARPTEVPTHKSLLVVKAHDYGVGQ